VIQRIKPKPAQKAEMQQIKLKPAQKAEMQTKTNSEGGNKPN